MSPRGGTRPRVLIAGGGVAALEALLALRSLASGHLELALLTADRFFVYRPVTVGEAFDRSHARSFAIASIAADQGAELVPDSLVHVDAAGHRVVTGSGAEVEFDHLVIATGARSRGALPGALTFHGRDDVPALRNLLQELVSGQARSVALALPSQTSWPLPLYELALMAAAHLRDHGSETAVTLVTPEEEPLELFGPAASRAVEGLLAARGVTLRTSSLPAMVRRRALVLAGGGVVFADRVITLPLAEGPAVPGVPHDRHGFIAVDRHGRVSGLEGVYAAGDVTAFPLKQGGLAAQQADAVAESIAAEVGVPITPQPFRPVLRGLLLTGGAPMYLRAEPQRLPREASVAIEAHLAPHPGRDASAAAGQPLWWPPAKIAGRYLAPYLATARPQPLSGELLVDKAPVPGAPLSESEHRDALELSLMMAGMDAKWGDYRSALEALDAAEALEGALPPEYEIKRREWQAAERTNT